MSRRRQTRVAVVVAAAVFTATAGWAATTADETCTVYASADLNNWSDADLVAKKIEYRFVERALDNGGPATPERLEAKRTCREQTIRIDRVLDSKGPPAQGKRER